MTAPENTAADTWAQAIALIDQLVSDSAQSKLTIAALMRELAHLRRELADRDGRIADLYARVASLTAGVR